MRHRHFPMAIGIWFSALIGLAILAIPAKVLGRLIAAPAPEFGVQLAGAAGLAMLGGWTAFHLARRSFAGNKASTAVSRGDEESVESTDFFADVPSTVLPDRSIAPLHLDILREHSDLPPLDLSNPLPDQKLDQETPPASALQPSNPVQPIGPKQTAGRSPVADAPLDTLGVVELLERLALALDDWRARNPGTKLPDLPGAAALSQLSALTQWFDDPSRQKTFEATNEEDDNDEDGDVDQTEDSDETDEPSDNRYASLIDMTLRSRMRPQGESGTSGDASLQRGSQEEVTDQALQAALAEVKRLSLSR